MESFLHVSNSDRPLSQSSSSEDSSLASGDEFDELHTLPFGVRRFYIKDGNLQAQVQTAMKM